MTEESGAPIKKITLTDATFEKSDQNIMEPKYINFIYGKNGVGKSTFSRTVAQNDDGHVEWGDGVSADEYEVLVYNSDFVKENFARYNDLPGVYTFTKENKQIRDEIDRQEVKKRQAQEELSQAVSNLEAKNREREKLDGRIQDICIAVYKTYKDAFPDAMVGSKQKGSFTRKVLGTEPKEHQAEALQTLYDAVFLKEAREYPLFQRASSDITYGRLHGRELLNEVIVSSSNSGFARFVDRIKAFDWLRASHDKFAGHTDGKCPYCQQKLPDSFESDIVACFDEQYEHDIEELAGFQRTYQNETQQIVRRLESNLEDVMPSLDTERYELLLDSLKKSIEINVRKVADKIKEPSIQVALEDTDSLLLQLGQLIDEFNQTIEANNRAIKDKKNKKKECTQAVWEFFSFLLQDDIRQYNQEQDAIKAELMQLEKRVEEVEQSIREITASISELNRNIVSTAAVRDDINQLLEASGFQGFSIRDRAGVSGTYEIVREDGCMAGDLSEGERNFIAFLYFYFRIKGSGSSQVMKPNKIVVIDDPVSGMDRGSRFIVSSLVRELIGIAYGEEKAKDEAARGGSIRQLFLLTHHAEFHREVAFEYNKIRDCERVAFFIIHKSDNVSTVEHCTRPNPDEPSQMINRNPVQTDYESLWMEFEQTDTVNPLLRIIRQIAEIYFIQTCGYRREFIREQMLRKYKDEPLARGQKMETDKLCAVDLLLSYMTSPEVTYVEDREGVLWYKSILRDIFEATNQLQHYELMCGRE